MNDKLRIRVWNEGVHEALNEPSHIGEIYPDGIHGAIAAGLRSFYPEAEITTAVLATDDEHGLDEEVLADTDVLLWWGHMAHHSSTSVSARISSSRPCSSSVARTAVVISASG